MADLDLMLHLVCNTYSDQVVTCTAIFVLLLYSYDIPFVDTVTTYKLRISYKQSIVIFNPLDQSQTNVAFDWYFVLFLHLTSP
jgi:hypothetical protein